MKKFLPLVFFSFTTILFAQDSPPQFDGVVNQEEWKNAQVFSLDYEIDPGDNTPAPFATKAYVLYTTSDLYVAFIASANMKTLRSSIRNRDEGFRDDNVLFGFDAYGDGRYMIAQEQT